MMILQCEIHYHTGRINKDKAPKQPTITDLKTNQQN